MIPMRQYARSSVVMLLKNNISEVRKTLVRKLSQKFRGPTRAENSQNDVILLENGLFAVNKPKHLGSTEVVEIIKSTLIPAIPAESRDTFKVGHGGVLDRTATGVLVIGVGRGCKLLSKFLHGVKEYNVTGQLGISTTTYNDVGDVTDELPYGHVTEEDLLKTLKKFQGKVTQIPPVYSALKQNGRRYSDLAREGKEITPIPRLVKCHSLVCTSFDPPLFTLHVKCGGGFYIRSLINDLGKEVGSCAHVQQLHRTQHGIFKEHEAIARDHWTLEQIMECIRKAKMSHWHIFKEPLQKHKRSERTMRKGSKHEKSIVFTEDMFDL